MCQQINVSFLMKWSWRAWKEMCSRVFVNNIVRLLRSRESARSWGLGTQRILETFGLTLLGSSLTVRIMLQPFLSPVRPSLLVSVGPGYCSWSYWFPSAHLKQGLSLHGAFLIFHWFQCCILIILIPIPHRVRLGLEFSIGWWTLIELELIVLLT